MTLIVYENIYALTSIIDWGGEWFLKILSVIKTPHTSYIKSCNKMICDVLCVRMRTIFKEFSLKLQIFCKLFKSDT